MTPFGKRKEEPLHVPALEEVSEEYAGLLQRQRELFAMEAELRDEQKRLRLENDADTTPAVRPGVAKLLGDPPDGKAARMERLGQIRQELADVEGALAAIRERMGPAKAVASRKIVEMVRPEYAARVLAICKALEAVNEAHKAYDDLRLELDTKDIAWTSLIPMGPTFLGGSREAENPIARYLKSAREAGYYGN